LTEETRLLCEYCRINPLGAFASGSLLVAVSHSASEKVIKKLLKAGIPATRIGRMIPKKNGMNLIKASRECALPVFHQDELSKYLAEESLKPSVEKSRWKTECKA